MSFPDHLTFMPPPFAASGDVSGFLPQFLVSNEYCDAQCQSEQPPPFKRPRNSEENQSDSTPYPPLIPTIQPPNAPINKGVNNIFFKTRMCAKFRVGQCRNGENCNFAHGIEDMRQPPLNWQELVNGREDDCGSGNWDDDQRIIHKMKLCKKYYNGEECPYGERCNFLHEDPKKFRDDSGRFRDSSAISIGTTGPPPLGHENVPGQPDNKSANNSLDAYRVNMRPVYWKTKLCSRYDATGQCPFAEKCHFAHGQAELQLHGGRSEVEMGIAGSIPAKPVIPAPYNDAPSSNTVTGVTSIQEGSEKKRLLKWKGPKKINHIYADWIDDLPLVHSLTTNTDS